MNRQSIVIASLVALALFRIIEHTTSTAQPISSRQQGHINIRVTVDDKPSAASITILPRFTAKVAGASGQSSVDAASGDYSIAASTTLDGALYVGRVEHVSVSAGQSAQIRLRLTKAPPKPTSAGAIQIVGRSLSVDGKPYRIHGVGYQPYAIGTGPGWVPKDQKVYRRDFPMLAKMHANTIRTWGQVDANLLDVAAENGIKVIAGFWVPYESNLSDPQTRAELIADLRRYVDRFKLSPAVLMWSLGNEQNYRNGKSRAWYSLVNELAWAAYDQEGARYHPVTTPNGEINNLGNSTLGSDDACLPYLDAFGANIYRGRSFGPLFQDYKRRSGKAFWISEYGVDCYDQRIPGENQDMQAEWDLKLSKEIDAANDIAFGGTLMAYCDQWWKNGSPDKHNEGGPRVGSDPDGVFDEEYWGVMSIARDTHGGIDVVTPRKTYFALQGAWQTR